MFRLSKHISEGEIKAYLDQSLEGSFRQRVQDHLAACPRCQRQAAAQRMRSEQVQKTLDRLSAPNTFPSASAARRQLESVILEKEQLKMTSKIPMRLRFALGALSVIVVLAVASAFPQVRAIASNFLSLFRIEQIALVPFDPDNVMLGRMDNELNRLFSETSTYKEVGSRQEVASIEDAEAIAGISVRLPDFDRLGEPRLYVEAGGQGNLKIDLPRVRGILNEAGYTDIVLPDNVDQAVISAYVPQAVVAEYGQCRTQGANSPNGSPSSSQSRQCVTLAQVSSPSIDAPPDLDLQQLGKAFLQLYGMAEQDAEVFSQNVDWATTLVMPIPYGADYREVDVDGVQGVLLLSKSSFSMYTIFWAKDGKLYILSGNLGSSFTALDIANSLK